MENIGINPARYGYNEPCNKQFDKYTLSIKFTPNNPNPDLPTAPTAASMTRGLTGVTTTTSPVVATPVATSASEGPAEKLVKLKKLLDAGVVTQGDFDQKKVELLAQM
jgi:hypothetical protein